MVERALRRVRAASGRARAARALIAVSLLGVAFSVASGSAEAAFPGENGKIVFARLGLNGPDDWRLYTMNPDGTDVTQVTQSGLFYLEDGSLSPHFMDGWPSFSPDGKKIVFQRKGPDNYELYMLTLNPDDPDGWSEKRLTKNAGENQGSERKASFSPDGKKLVFEANGGVLENKGCWDLYTMDLMDPNAGDDASKWTRITLSCRAGRASEWPAWSPDGTKIAFTRSVGGSYELFTVKPDGTGEKRLTETAYTEMSPTFSPDGKRIGYHGSGADGWGFYTINADDGSDPDYLKNSNGGTGQQFASFSPDGKQLAFMAIADPSCLTIAYQACVDNIFTMNVTDDGTGQKNLTNWSLDERFPDWGIVPGTAPKVAVANASVSEGDKGQTQVSFTVSLSRPVSHSVSVNYNTADGSATAAGKFADYTATSGTLTFAAGETSKTVTVPVTGDTRPEPDETFHLDLSGPSVATIAGSRGTGTIVNDDGKK